MKIVIEVKDELVKQFGEEAVRIYLARKAEKLEELLHQNTEENTDPAPSDSVSDEETLNNSWEKFNKRGISC